jgi:tetratricopeptide (TPR) repeat protein
MKNSAIKQAMATNLGNIGIVHLYLSDYALALEYYGKALALDEELGNKAGVARHLGNIGNVHYAESLGLCPCFGVHGQGISTE